MSLTTEIRVGVGTDPIVEIDNKGPLPFPETEVEKIGLPQGLDPIHMLGQTGTDLGVLDVMSTIILQGNTLMF